MEYVRRARVAGAEGISRYSMPGMSVPALHARTTEGRLDEGTWDGGARACGTESRGCLVDFTTGGRCAPARGAGYEAVMARGGGYLDGW